MMAYAYNLITQEAEAGGFLRVQRKTGPHNAFSVSQDFIMSTYPKINNYPNK